MKPMPLMKLGKRRYSETSVTHALVILRESRTTELPLARTSKSDSPTILETLKQTFPRVDLETLQSLMPFVPAMPGTLPENSSD